MGDENPELYLFDTIKKVWSQKTAMPGRYFSIAYGNGNLYEAGGEMMSCWQYKCSNDSWTKLSSPALKHYYGTLIFHQNSLLLLGGCCDDIEGYATEENLWVVAPYKLPKKLMLHYAFLMDIGK